MTGVSRLHWVKGRMADSSLVNNDVEFVPRSLGVRGRERPPLPVAIDTPVSSIVYSLSSSNSTVCCPQLKNSRVITWSREPIGKVSATVKSG